MTGTIPSEIARLLQQRETYRRWLDRLEEFEEDVRREVAERVRSDYRERLQGVQDELAGHREELTASVEERTARLEELEAEHEAALAEREEDELRHRIGEHDEAEWKERRRSHDEAVAEVEERLRSERQAVEELESALAAMDAGPSEAAARPLTLVSEDEGEEGGDAGGEEREEGANDELEFLESLSLDDTEQYDAVSAMLESKERGQGERSGEGRRSDGEGDGG